MFFKTTSEKSTEFFSFVSTNQSNQIALKKKVTINKHDSQVFLRFTKKVHLKPFEGLALVVFAKDPSDPSTYQSYILADHIQVNPGVYFNTLTVTRDCTVYMQPTSQAAPKMFSSAQLLTSGEFKTQLSVDHIYGIIYQMKSHSESIPFHLGPYYELLVIDQGELDVIIDSDHQHIKKNDCLILRSDQPYQKQQGSSEMVAYISILFEASGIPESALAQPMNLGTANRQIIERIIKLAEYPEQFVYPNDEIKLKLATLILQLIQGQTPTAEEPITSMRENYENDLFQSILDFLDQNIATHNQVNDLVEHFALSRSTLQNLFKKYLNMTPKNYINQVRLDRSKHMIRNTQMTLSQIADYLGYGSIQYFSRAFSQAFGMSPSQYAKSMIQ